VYMSMEEIHAKYNGQWVYMINCKKGEYWNVIGGEVVAASKNRDDIFKAMLTYRKEKSMTYFRYAGIIPESENFLL